MKPCFLALVVALLPACGGKVVLDGSSSTGAGGASTTGTTSGGGGSPACPALCPTSPPNQGDPCPCAGEICDYDQCPEDGAMIAATCSAGAFQVVANEQCTTIPCGMTECMEGEICMLTESPVEHVFTCIPDLCPGMSLTCACAASLCPGDCISASGSQLVCGCDTCP